MAFDNFNSRAFAKLATITVVADDDGTAAVKDVPVKTTFIGWEVRRAESLRNL